MHAYGIGIHYECAARLSQRHDAELLLKPAEKQSDEYSCQCSEEGYQSALKEEYTGNLTVGSTEISERHRHRYEVNNDYRDALTSHGMKLSGLSPDGRIVEMIEIPEHPWFIATQAHPELKSRPNRPHPLFKGFVEAALEFQK